MYYEPAYIFVLLLSILSNWSFFVWVRKRNYCNGEIKALTYYQKTLIVVINLAPLAFFKYGTFIGENFSSVFSVNFSPTEFALPLAISFFTFQQISFQLDNHKRHGLDVSFKSYLLFITFFPQLIAGPIVHYEEVYKQFLHLGKRTSRLGINFIVGVTIFGIGLLKKTVFADQFSNYSDPLFHAAELGEPLSFLEAGSGMLAFTFQIYFDFSGYSDMALGLAKIFGLSLPFNFNSPYKTKNISLFWRQWHITLSRFLRDYIYIPLGGSRQGQVSIMLTLLTVMMIGGLWHGASWTFVLWGGIHGFMLVINRAWRGSAIASYLRIPTLLSILMTFSVVSLSWVFFRAETFDGALVVLSGVFLENGFVLRPQYAEYMGPLLPLYEAIGGTFGPVYYWAGPQVTAWLIAGFLVVWLLPNTQEFMGRYVYNIAYDRGEAATVITKKSSKHFWRKLEWRPTTIGILFTILIVSLSLIVMTGGGMENEFIYFQF